jgi:hypothetical protein
VGPWVLCQTRISPPLLCGREPQILLTRVHHVESCVVYGREAASVCDGERWGNTHYARKEVVLPCVDDPFGQVGAMYVGGRLLELDLFIPNQCLDVMGGFVVELVEVREESSSGKPGVDLCEGVQQFFLGLALDGDGFDVVCVVHIEQCIAPVD